MKIAQYVHAISAKIAHILCLYSKRCSEHAFDTQSNGYKKAKTGDFNS